jgi:hypothetical protein
MRASREVHMAKAKVAAIFIAECAVAIALGLFCHAALTVWP